MKNWPNFFIVGVPKAGTTSLYEYLKDVPGIFLSDRKEPGYFSRSSVPANSIHRPIRDKEEYLNLFEKVKDEKIVGEASPHYLTDVYACELIHQVSPPPILGAGVCVQGVFRSGVFNGEIVVPMSGLQSQFARYQP